MHWPSGVQGQVLTVLRLPSPRPPGATAHAQIRSSVEYTCEDGMWGCYEQSYRTECLNFNKNRKIPGFSVDNVRIETCLVPIQCSMRVMSLTRGHAVNV